MSENSEKSDFFLDNLKQTKLLGFSKNQVLKLKSASKLSISYAFSDIGCVQLYKI